MKSTLDIVDIIYTKLSTSSLKAAITGDLYKLSRPTNSDLEDVVINSLTVNNGQMQEGVFNANIYVKNIEARSGNAHDKVANFKRLKTLASLAITALFDVWDVDYNYEIQNQTLIEDPEANAHFINIRIDFYSINSN